MQDFLNSSASLMHKLVYTMQKWADKNLHTCCEITFNQFLFLLHIENCKSLNQKQLAEDLGFTPAAVSKQLDQLREKQLLEVMQNKQNRRENVLNLTVKGKESLEQAMKVLNDQSIELFSCLNQTENQNLHQYFTKLEKQINN